ncbi:MAG: Stp1/IreP family PP2C-type Ser/Thr phosphatase [Agathobacter sp.]|nr:Stp1/IreP family PP2C-type Ser/Thr phosphatase [Agathobacter sp.]
MKTFSITDTGVLRTINQDYCFSSDTAVGKLPNLYIVCDGMGGHKAGEYASRYTVERIVASVSRSRWNDPVRVLREAIQKANEILVIEASENQEKQGMGTTVVVATIIDHKLHVANVGDSRLYVVNEQIEQITRDHSYVQEMVLRGEVAPEDARTHEKKNVITRAVGADKKIDIDFFEVELDDKDTVLICTDGLTNMVTDDKIHQVIMTHVSVESACKALIEEANHNGGADNITAVVIKPFHEEVKVC